MINNQGLRNAAKLRNEMYYEVVDPCLRGHLSKRWTKSGSCTECARNFTQENKILHLWASAKARAKRQGVPFDIQLEDIIVPEYCPILGIPLKFAERVCNDNSPSIDKIVPTLGYVKGNFHVISFRANTIKSNATVEELRVIANFLEKLSVEAPPA